MGGFTAKVSVSTATGTNAPLLRFLAKPRLESCNPLLELDSGFSFVCSLQANLQSL